MNKTTKIINILLSLSLVSGFATATFAADTATITNLTNKCVCTFPPKNRDSYCKPASAAGSQIFALNIHKQPHELLATVVPGQSAKMALDSTPGTAYGVSLDNQGNNYVVIVSNTQPGAQITVERFAMQDGSNAYPIAAVPVDPNTCKVLP